MSGLQSTIFGGGYRGAILSQQVVMASRVWTCQIAGDYLLTAIGPGGSGALAPASGNGRGATGGQAGGLAQKRVSLNAGDQLTLTIGAGGAAQATAGANGNAGGVTTVVGAGVNLVANGGEGGKTAPAGAGTIPGASAGGTASGGDINVTGGGSGSATVAAVASCMAVTGGGAVGVYGTGYASGNASSSGGFIARTGGAGVGGNSGDATSSTTNTDTKGGSSTRPSASATNGGGAWATNALNANATFSSSLTISAMVAGRLLSPIGGPTTNGNGEPGAGGVDAYIPGIFGGSAANSIGNTSGVGATIGGGGGGCTYPSGVGDPGGQGVVIIELLGVKS